MLLIVSNIYIWIKYNTFSLVDFVKLSINKHFELISGLSPNIYARNMSKYIYNIFYIHKKHKKHKKYIKKFIIW